VRRFIICTAKIVVQFVNSAIKNILVELFKSFSTISKKMETVISITSKQKNISIQLYLALERGIFIELTRVHNQPKKLEQSHRPPTIKQHRQQTNLLTSKIRLVNLQ
jgi:hypothetical protein